MQRGFAGLLLVLFLLAVLSAAAFAWVLTLQNQMVRLDQSVRGAWAQVENQFQRRSDLIPRYVELVREYAQHEREVFGHIASARAQLMGAGTPQERLAANARLDGLLGRLLVIVERYPDLKASENYLALQHELAGTENRIALERRRYNQAVEEYNRTAQSFPTRWFIAQWPLEREKPFFQAPEETKEPADISPR